MSPGHAMSPPKTHTLKPELQGPWNETVFGDEVLKR